jgi:hypothetical protein|tara:strand:- start:1009 stop:1212 length:204 start_codon:yes stop_codon:yes gene_type:complete
MPTQQEMANKKVVLFNKDWNYYVFFHYGDQKITKSGPWSQSVANSLRDELLINNVCAWVKRLDEDKE